MAERVVRKTMQVERLLPEGRRHDVKPSLLQHFGYGSEGSKLGSLV